jgi:hypothetical protein
MGKIMKTYCFALAAIAAMGFASAAYAGDVSNKTTTTTAAPTVMSDNEMDKVTAGSINGPALVGELSGQHSFNGLNGPAPSNKPPAQAIPGLSTAVGSH